MYSHRLAVLSLVFLLIISFPGCHSDSDPSPELVAQLRTLLLAQGYTGDPSAGRVLPNIDDPLAQLGKKLFASTDLSGQGDSCVTCHHVMLGGGDGLSLPLGVGAATPMHLGPGRLEDNGGPNVPRNALTTFNVGMLDRSFLWDGRIASMGETPGMNGGDGVGISTPDSGLDAIDDLAGDTLSSTVPRFPITDVTEMRADFMPGATNEELRTALAAKLAGSAAWRTEFFNVFGDTTITYARVGLAIGEFLRSQIFVNSPWRNFVQGDDSALGDGELRGALLFFNSLADEGANCSSCHIGDTFADQGFYTVAFPQIGPGKGDGINGDEDFGRFRETGDLNDMYRFRTPSLLNVEMTGPWGHSGSYVNLEDVVRHQVSPSTALERYDVSSLSPTIAVSNLVPNTTAALDALAVQQAGGENTIVDLDLSDSQIRDIVAFLRSLTDPCLKDRQCASPWIVSSEDDPDGGLNLLIAVDGNGNLL